VPKVPVPGDGHCGSRMNGAGNVALESGLNRRIPWHPA